MVFRLLRKQIRFPKSLMKIRQFLTRKPPVGM